MSNAPWPKQVKGVRCGHGSKRLSQRKAAVTIKVTEDQKRQLREGAEREDMSVAAYVLRRCFA